MEKRQLDPDREDRIDNQIVVDAYGPEEQAMGWYYYLENKIRFPLCSTKAEIPNPWSTAPIRRMHHKESSPYLVLGTELPQHTPGQTPKSPKREFSMNTS